MNNIKKRILKIGVAVAIFIAILTGAFAVYYVHSVENFKKISFDEVLKVKKDYYADRKSVV